MCPFTLDLHKLICKQPEYVCKMNFWLFKYFAALVTNKLGCIYEFIKLPIFLRMTKINKV